MTNGNKIFAFLYPGNKYMTSGNKIYDFSTARKKIYIFFLAVQKPYMLFPFGIYFFLDSRTVYMIG